MTALDDRMARAARGQEMAEQVKTRNAERFNTMRGVVTRPAWARDERSGPGPSTPLFFPSVASHAAPRIKAKPTPEDLRNAENEALRLTLPAPVNSVLDVLTEAGGWRTVAYIADHCGQTTERVRLFLNRLRDSGWVTRSDDGKAWAATD